MAAVSERSSDTPTPTPPTIPPPEEPAPRLERIQHVEMPQHSEISQNSKDIAQKSQLFLAYAVIAAVILPILTFSIIPGFMERMIIVAIVFAAVAAGLVREGVFEGGSGVFDGILCAGVYGCLMAVLAGVCM